jgi:DNA-directed RNA polymerase specialized sigma24 family protein
VSGLAWGSKGRRASAALGTFVGIYDEAPRKRDVLVIEQLFERLERTLESLPLRDQEVFKLRFADVRSHDEIARWSKTSPERARALVGGVVDRLQAVLEGDPTW